MFTTENYFEKIKAIDFSQLPQAIQDSHSFIVELTNNGSNWEDYYESASIKETVDIYFDTLGKQLSAGGKKTPVKRASKSAAPKRKRAELLPSKARQSKKPPDIKQTRDTPTLKRSTEIDSQAVLVERLPEELRFIRRFLNLNGKIREKEDLLRFINALQKAILEKRIRKSSAYAEQIEYIQDGLIETYNSMKGKTAMQIKPDTYEAMKRIVEGEKVLPSINFIKRYIGMNGKTGVKEKAKLLLQQIDRAYENGKVTDRDAYAVELSQIKRNLRDFIGDRNLRTLDINKATLHGLLGVLDGNEKKKLYDTVSKKTKAIRKKGNIITFVEEFYPRGTKAQGYKQIIVAGIEKDRSGAVKIIGHFHDSPWFDNFDKLIEAIDWDWMENAHRFGGLDTSCSCSLSGVDEKPTVMNSVDFANLQFKTLGFTGKWRELIGDPSPGFTAMVFGKPKFGKSTLCVEFAGYLARQHGRVLYVAKEEGLDRTLQDKLNNSNVKHPNLDVASVLPESLAEYDFIFLDSVNRLGLAPEDLRRLKAFNPTKSFVYIFQSTKQGSFRGENSFQHDVDVVIEVPEKGKALQMGRFNQGGQMQIF